jgi:hypothetical protein
MIDILFKCILYVITTGYLEKKSRIILKVQGEHKVFPWLQTFITRKIRGIQTYATVT